MGRTTSQNCSTGSIMATYYYYILASRFLYILMSFLWHSWYCYSYVIIFICFGPFWLFSMIAVLEALYWILFPSFYWHLLPVAVGFINDDSLSDCHFVVVFKDQVMLCCHRILHQHKVLKLKPASV